MSNKYKILVVEDENNIRSFIETTLTTNDYQVLGADSCKSGIMMFGCHMPDLVILDLGLPDMDGTELIKEIRKTHTTPIIVLSARTDEKDKVEALDFGANDYVTKPFGTQELMARVRATLRSRMQNADIGAVMTGKYQLHDLQIDYDRRLVHIGNDEVKLTQTEYNILALLARYTGKVLTYAFIIKEIWGAMDTGGIKRLQVNMANLRKKLGAKPGENKYIINELGVGYRMCEECL
jgi:two-component system KDP operon response regulator KdpE